LRFARKLRDVGRDNDADTHVATVLHTSFARMVVVIYLWITAQRFHDANDKMRGARSS
jgi:hypothetical protein